MDGIRGGAIVRDLEFGELGLGIVAGAVGSGVGDEGGATAVLVVGRLVELGEELVRVDVRCEGHFEEVMELRGGRGER
jgi:hypothetical protein